MAKEGISVSQPTIGKWLEDSGYVRKKNKKSLAGGESPHRDWQFRYVRTNAEIFQEAGQPVLSIDCKKKENIGNFSQDGTDYVYQGDSVETKDHDFYDKKLGKAIPYGIYDVARNEGFFLIGTSHETPEFVKAALEQWYIEKGKKEYPNMTSLLLEADCGGSNGANRRLFKQALFELANEWGITIYVCHYSPYASKWNPIERMLFSAVSENWRANPLTSLDKVKNLIEATTNLPGLKITAAIDRGDYPLKLKISDEEYSKIMICRDAFYEECNYAIYSND
jgi:hypothetical protein